jgi:hypothetical protein
LVELANEMASILGDSDHVFLIRSEKFGLTAYMGLPETDDIWLKLGNSPVDIAHYLPGSKEYKYALYKYWQGNLSAELIDKAKQQAQYRSDEFMVDVLKLEGGWHLERREWPMANKCLSVAIKTAQNAGLRPDPVLQARFVTARFHLGVLEKPRAEFLRLSKGNHPSHRYIAELWLEIGDQEQAKSHALAAYDEFWGEGEPFVFRYGLNKVVGTLTKLGVDVPNKKGFDFSQEERQPWEDAVYQEVLDAKRQSESNSE